MDELVRGEVFNKVKELLGITKEDISKDTYINFAIDDALESILNYCNLDCFPAGLKNTLIKMSLDYFRSASLGSVEEEGQIRSISEGDTSIGYEKVDRANLEKTFLGNYRIQLNRYRKLTNPRGYRCE